MNNKITIKATVDGVTVYEQVGLESRLFIGPLTELPNGPVVVSVSGGGANVELAVDVDIPQLVQLANGFRVRARTKKPTLGTEPTTGRVEQEDTDVV